MKSRAVDFSFILWVLAVFRNNSELFLFDYIRRVRPRQSQFELNNITVEFVVASAAPSDGYGLSDAVFVR